jgi:hypothetical protein
MLSLKMSNGQYLTYKDVEKYINECSKFIKEKYEKEKLVKFEFDEFLKEIKKQIDESILKYESIEMIIDDIKRIEQIKDGKIWDDYIEDTIKVRGEEQIGKWDPYGDGKRDIYIIEYRLSFKTYKNPYDIDDVLPKYKFFEILSEKPQNVKRGDLRKIQINFYRPEKYSVFTGIDVRFYNKSNILPIELYETKTSPNCFVVTTVMGDFNHPVVVDFRKFRDEVMLNYYFGRLFIKIYYKIGPILSFIIKQNNSLLLFSRKMIMLLHKKLKNDF